MLKSSSTLGTTATKRMTGRRLQVRNRRLFAKNPWCVDCEAEGVQRLADEQDHDVPLHLGGADHESNLRGRCHEHHAVKSAREAGDRARGGGER